MAFFVANLNVEHNVQRERISFFMSSWEIYSIRLVMEKVWRAAEVNFIKKLFCSCFV